MAVKASSEALKKKIQLLAARADGGSFELAEALCEARALPKTPEGGRPTLSDLAELAKVSLRTVSYLISVWERFEGLDVPRDRLVKEAALMKALRQLAPQGLA